ncbi:MAG: hypothetical protein KIG36_01985, partial [Eubacteriales bacterium]|nr:hypothetical protein [Eubacteriales bacterium]
MNFKRLIGFLLVFTLLFLAAFPAMALTPTREVPEWLPGVIAYDFSDVVNPDFTSSAGEDHGFFYSGGSASEAAKITGSLVDLDGGKGVQLNVTDDLTNVHCHMDAAKVGQWPEAGSPVYGFFLRVTTGDEGIDLCRFRMRYDIVDGTVEDKTDLLCACYLGMGTFGCLRLFDLNGNENYDDVSDGSGYDACVYLPPHFDGYVVIEYSDTVYLELAGYGAEYGAVDAACLRWPDYTSKSFQFYCMMSTYEDSCVTFSDLGYLTGFIGESPSTPTEAPTQAPT